MVMTGDDRCLPPLDDESLLKCRDPRKLKQKNNNSLRSDDDDVSRDAAPNKREIEVVKNQISISFNWL